MIDSHCHPQFPQYDNDREEVIKRALGRDVQMICVGTDLETSKQAIELANKYNTIWATVGLHPNDYLEETFDPEKYYKLGCAKKVVAIGEIGLDYYRTPEPEKRNIQKKRLIQQMQIAADLELPVIFHCRDAYFDLVELLKTYSPKPRAVVHSFTGTWQEAKQFIDLGFYIGLNGIITFPPSHKATDGQVATNLDEVVNKIPLDKILIETDAPFLAPPPFRGKRNEPSYVKYVAEKIAEIKAIDLDEAIKITVENTKKLFKLQ